MGGEKETHLPEIMLRGGGWLTAMQISALWLPPPRFSGPHLLTEAFSFKMTKSSQYFPITKSLKV